MEEWAANLSHRAIASHSPPFLRHPSFFGSVYRHDVSPADRDSSYRVQGGKACAVMVPVGAILKCSSENGSLTTCAWEGHRSRSTGAWRDGPPRPQCRPCVCCRSCCE